MFWKQMHEKFERQLDTYYQDMTMPKPKDEKDDEDSHDFDIGSKNRMPVKNIN